MLLSPIKTTAAYKKPGMVQLPGHPCSRNHIPSRDPECATHKTNVPRPNYRGQDAAICEGHFEQYRAMVKKLGISPGLTPIRTLQPRSIIPHRHPMFAQRARPIALPIITSLALITPPAQALNPARQGMVTSAHPLASQVGQDILAQGGNAIDAAIATTLAISVVEPFSAGIGGGGFALFHEAKTGTMRSLDFRERAPLKAKADMYRDAQGKVMPRASIDGHRSVAVPGTIAGLVELHQRHGKLVWAKLVEPSARLAAQGFPASARYRSALQSRAAAIQANPAAAQIFLPQGKLPELGDRVIQTDLARTLQTLAQKPQDFYQGGIARAIVRDMQANQGIISAADLQQYRPIWRDPVCAPWQQYRVCSMPPPSSGGVHLLQLLNLVDTPALKKWGWHHPDGLHRIIESMKIAYADRATHLGDPDFVRVPVQSLISPAYAAQRRQEIQPDRARPAAEVMAGVLPKPAESSDTSHLTVVDRDRNAVSLTFTVNLSFGSGAVAQSTGIILNNEMDDFASAPDVPNAFGLTGQTANAIAPRKTPLSSMTPTIITENDKVRLALGAPGGSTIITTVFQITLNHLVYDMGIEQSVAAPRLHQQWRPETTRLDRWGFDPLTVANLTQRGHQLIEREPWGNANAIAVGTDGSLTGAVDPRGEGAVAGY